MAKKNVIGEVYMKPLKEIHPQGAEQLMKAIYIFAVKDYLESRKYLATHTNRTDAFFKAKAMYEETKSFLGDALCESIDRSGIAHVRYADKRGII